MQNLDKYTYLLTKNRDFQKLFYAKLITFSGDWFLVVPLLGIVYELTNNALLTSTVLIVQSAPMVLFSSFGGYLADKYDRRVILTISEFLSALAVLLVMYAVSTENVFYILSSYFMLLLVNVAYMPTSDAALPNIVKRELLPEANVLFFSTWGIAAGLGAGLGGLLSSILTRNQLFTINFLSFVISAFLIFLIKTNLSEDRNKETTFENTKLSDGLNFARNNKNVLYLVITKGTFGISAAGLLALFTILSVDVYSTGDYGSGLMWGARGVGAFVGPLLFRYFYGSSDGKLLSTIGPGIMIWGIFYFLIPFSASLYLTVFLLIIAHCGGGAQWAFSSYGLQILTPDKLRGRIAGIDYTFYFSMYTISNLLIGYLATKYDILLLFRYFPMLGFLFGFIWYLQTRQFWRELNR